MKKGILKTSVIITSMAIVIASCKKDEELATVITSEVTDITARTATSGGEISSDGGAEITACGVCWGTTKDLTINDSITTDDTSTETFTSSIVDLTASTTYYVRAYASNNAGTAYGNVISFSTTGVTDIDGNSYNTVTIGTQTWFAENLATTTNNDGTPISNITVNDDWASATTGAYCWYNNDEEYATDKYYGALYNWYAVETSKLCPTGWHVPSDDEWNTLEIYLGMSQSEANNLGYRGTNHGSQLAGNAYLWDDGRLENNTEFGSSGFNVLPCGRREFYSKFRFVGGYSFIWTSTESNIALAYSRNLLYDITKVDRYNYRKESGFSVRCVKDSE